MASVERVRPLRMVGRCELFEEIDSGGMATVHLGRQTAIGGFAKIVAIKRMHHQFAKDPQFVAMFLDEARLVARIKHPNVLPTLDLIDERGELFIVMEYLPGVTLGQLQIAVYKREERIPVPIALRIICGMLHGLNAAHEAKGPNGEPLQLVHRDVSPENIFVGTDGVTRLLDFGMARALDRLHITQAGEVKGKLSVMAPEQVQGKIVTRQTDVFASGVVLWQALTGQRLIQGEHMAEIAHNVVHQVFEPPTHRVPSLPKKLDAIVMRALERDPEKRWPNAEKMAIALEAVCDLATQREVGMWVQRVAWKRLADRAKLVAAIESTPVGVGADKRLPPPARGAARVPAAEDSGGAMATSAPHSLDRLGQAASALLASSRETLAAMVQRNAEGKIDLAATMKQPRVAAIAALGALATILLVALIASSGEDASAASASGITPPTIIPAAKSAPPASSAQPKTVDPRAPIPAGEVLLGCNTWADTACALDEMPGRKVKLGAFEIDRTEVTVREYRACVDAGECNDKHVTEEGIEGVTLQPIEKCNYGRDGREDHPINCVSHDQASAYCKWAGGSLPTEAQWQKAAAGGDSWPYPTGESTLTCEHAVMSQQGDGCGRGTTWPVGSKPKGKSPYGALDMAGNVAEWVIDWYDARYYREAPESDPAGPAQGAMRSVRGGNWRDAAPRMLRTSARDKRPPATHSIQVGFRCVYAAK